MKDAIVRFLPASIMLVLAITIAWQSGYADEIWAAWSALSAYGTPVIILGCAVWWLVMRRRLEKAHQAIAGREAAVGLQEEQVRIDMTESKRIRQAAQDREKAVREEAARHKQESAAQVEDAKARLGGSVGTNIGRQKLIQRLRERVSVLEAENQELRKQAGESEGAE
ncbi:MAG: hypothetical protein OXP66_16240 [Candidatus Tectomicrobia bacterium]|nr:hypothetical protein [Candidatus Tectomicrobia bacterium]